MDKLKNVFVFITVVVLIILAAYAGYLVAFRNLILPRVRIAEVEVSGMDKNSALALIDHYFKNNPAGVILRYNGKENNKFENFDREYDFNWAVDQAMLIGRSGNILTKINEQRQILLTTRDIQLPIKYDTDEFEGILDDVEKQMNQDPIWPSLKISNNNVKVVEGKNGLTVDREKLKEGILKNLSIPGKHLIDIPMQVIIAKQSNEQANKALVAAQYWLGKTLTIKVGDSSVELLPEKIISLFGLYSEPIDTKTYEVLIKDIKPKIEIEPKDAIFTFENNKVKEFKPEVVGKKIDIPAFKDKLAEMLYKSDSNTLDVPVILSYPKITTGQINNLGIKELIGKGTSMFQHSIPGRVFNVNLAASRVNGVIVAPGDEFSFNNNVGEISRDTGYQSAYIISGGRTVLGDGGGVCQVSTTVFRAALNAGLPITERKGHAYRVGYYEQDGKVGLDATVFSPSVDLKFKNDTGNHILIQTSVDTKKLTMSVEIYGTSDNRKVTISNSRISSQIAPPATIYVDDPTLPIGTTKQIDWSAWGSKVAFDYKVERGGETLIDKTFYTSYQPWQAIYVKGTKVN